MSYKILADKFPEGLASKVSELVKAGYSPQGGPVYFSHHLIQAMFKKPDKAAQSAPSKAEYSSFFQMVWDAYPKRAGSNPKKAAFAAFNQRMKEIRARGEKEGGFYVPGEDKMYAGVIRYAKFCEATNKLDTELVMQARRFFGPGLEFENDWAVPAVAVRVPQSDAEATKWGADRGIEPKIGESMYDYRKRLEGSL